MYYVLERLDASSIKELLPADIIARNGLIGPLEAYRQIHFPAEDSPIERYNQMRSPAHERLIFGEFFWLVFAVGLTQQGRDVAPKGAFIITGDRVREGVSRVLL